MSHSVFWDGGYINTTTQGLTGTHLMMQRRLILAAKRGALCVVAPSGDELPVVQFRNS